MTTRENVLRYALEQFGTQPEYLWPKSPNDGVLRHQSGAKWYGVLMNLPRQRLGIPGEGTVDILNLKCGPVLLGSLLGKEGYLPAYHMSKGNWVSIRLDGTVPEEDIFWLLGISYDLTRPKGRKKP